MLATISTTLSRGLMVSALVAFSSLAVSAEPVSGTFTTKSSTRLNYLTMGDSGSWVVLIPGLSDNPQRMYVDSGIASALAKNHRVVALPDPGTYRPDEPIELLDHLKIDKAHLYGYSQGGGFAGHLLAKYPTRWITAAFGGSGIWEYDQKEHDRAYALDQAMFTRAGRAGDGRGGAAGRGGPSRGGARGGSPSSDDPLTALVPVAAARPHSKTPIDLYKVDIPILAINGAFDQPFEKTERMFRELRDFTNVILPGLDHMTAIGVRSTFPPKHVEALVRFIESNDVKK